MLYNQDTVKPWYFGDTQPVSPQGDTENINAFLKEAGLLWPSIQKVEKRGSVWKIPTFFQEFWWWVDNLIWWAMANAPSMLWNTLGFIADVVTPEKYEWLWDILRAWWEKDTGRIQKILWTDADAFMTKAWEMWSEIATLFTPTWFAKAFTKYPEVVKWLQVISEKSPKLYSTIKSGIMWATEMWKFQVVSEWEVTKWDLALWAGLWIWFNILWWAAKLTKNFLQKELPDRLVVSGLVNPADLRNVSERLAKLTWKDVEIADTSRWLLRKWIQWDKEQVRVWIKEAINASKQQVDDFLVKNTEVVNNNITNNLQKALTEKMQNYWKFDKVTWNFIPKAGNEGMVDDMLELITSPWMTYNQINNARRILWEDLFAKTWTMKELASKSGWQNIWKETSQFLDDALPWFRVLNKDVEVWMALSKAIAQKEARELSNQILSYMWFGSWLGWLATYFSWETDPVEILKWIAIWWTIWIAWWEIKKLFTSTQLKTKLANILSPLSGQDKRIAKEFITEWVTDKLTPGLIDTLKQAIKWARDQSTKLWESIQKANIPEKISSKDAFIQVSSQKKKLIEKIKDSNNPNIGYHGTNAEFDQFLAEKMWKWTGSAYWDGIYLSTSQDVAKTYADLIAWLKGWKAILLDVVIPDELAIKTYTWPRTWIKAFGEQAKKEWYKWIKFETWKDYINIPWRKVNTAWEYNYLIFNPEDAQIIKSHVIKELWFVKWVWLLRDLMTAWVVGLSAVEVWRMVLEKTLKQNKNKFVNQTPKW